MTLCTSVTDPGGKAAAKTAFVYLLTALFLVFFGAVYELFSHGVYSYYMIYAFAFPLAGGTLPFSLLHLFPTKKYPGTVVRGLYHCGIATLTAGSIVRGVLDIYGTTNALAVCYWPVGVAQILAGLAMGIWQMFFKCKDPM